MSMTKNNGLFIIKDYGKISLHIGELMDRKGINRSQLCKMIGVRFEVANRFYKGKIERLDLDILARICYVLDCDVHDLLEYKKE